MNKENKIVPKLRFPEFEEQWENEMLGNKKVSFFPSDKTPKNELEIKTYVSTENLLPDYGGVKKSSKLPDSGSFTSFQKGDILVANIRPYLKKVWFADRSGAASNDVIVFRNGSSISEGYLQHILKNDLFINYVMKGAKGVKMPRGDKSLMKKYPVYFPKNPKEQEKIANCLSSLDNVINAETEKLALLKDHKKGLLQKLFPAEGETQPKFRFPKFKNDGDWEEKRLDEIAKVVTGSTPKTSDSENYGGNKLFVSPADISEGRYIIKTGKTLSEKGFSKSRIIPVNSILFVCIGSTIGKLAQNKIECTTNQQINSLIPFKDNSNDFIYSLLENDSNYIASLSAQQAVPLINKSEFSAVKLHFPTNPKEQQKIANCLSAIDDLIEAQAQKIEELKDHKKGLLQQLFPTINELTI